MNIVWQNWKKGEGMKNVKKEGKKKKEKRNKGGRLIHGGVSVKKNDKLSRHSF